MKQAELIQGKIYWCQHGNGGPSYEFIFRNENNCEKCLYINIANRTYGKEGCLSEDNGMINYRLPIALEERHFMECEKANKYVGIKIVKKMMEKEELLNINPIAELFN